MSNPVQFLHPQSHPVNRHASRKMATPKISKLPDKPLQVNPVNKPSQVNPVNKPSQVIRSIKPSPDIPATNSTQVIRSTKPSKIQSIPLSESEIKQMCEVYPKLRTELNETRDKLDAYEEQCRAHRDAEHELVSTRRKLERSEEALRSERAKNTAITSQIASSHMELNKFKDNRRSLEKLNTDLLGRIEANALHVPRCIDMMAHVNGLLLVCAGIMRDQPDVHKEILATRDTVQAFSKSLQ